MSPDKTNNPSSKLCPTCGTRVSESAKRCPVCGSNLGSTTATKGGAAKGVQGTRMPEITLSLPAALGFLALFLGIGAVPVFFLMKSTPPPTSGPTPTQTIAATATITPTPTITLTPTLEMTATPLPPVEYQIKSGDTCGGIAVLYGLIDARSIIEANPSINATCSNLVQGMTIKVPQPTATPPPAATATLSSAAATQAACTNVDYTIQPGDSLAGIAANYNVSVQEIKQFNGLVNEALLAGNIIKIPLCNRVSPNEPTRTPTAPPPYAAPNLLLPADGSPFGADNDTVTLQWASVGTLRPNESYMVIVEDVTEGTGRKLVEYVTDQKFTVPLSFRPTDSQPHVMRWTVATVRQSGTTKENEPIWDTAGASSVPRVFIWSGEPSTAPVPSEPTATP